MRIAHFIQRYPPALGGSEVYFARLSRHLVERGHEVTVFTTNAYDLEAFWTTRGRCLRAGRTIEDGVEVRRYRLLRCPEHRRVLKVLSFLPHRPWPGTYRCAELDSSSSISSFRLRRKEMSPSSSS